MFLEVDKLRAGYGAVEVLHEVSLHVNEGEIVSILGANGAGKTTTLQTISGLATYMGGAIRLRGEAIHSLPSHQIVTRGLTQSLSCNQKVRDFFCKAVSVDLKTTVLIMKGRIDHDRDFSHINAVVHVHTEHGRDSLFDSSLTSQDLDHRSIQPYTLSSTWNFNTTAFLTLTDNTGSIYVTGFQRMNISFSVCIYKLCTNGTNLLCYQGTKNL